MVKVENWNGKRVFVARQDGRILTWRRYKGSGLLLDDAVRILKQNNTFYKNRVKKKTRASNFNETVISRNARIDPQNPNPLRGRGVRRPKGKVRYFVRGEYGGQEIYASSMTVGVEGHPNAVRNAREARAKAWQFFLEKVGAVAMGLENYGQKTYLKGVNYFNQGVVENVQEGWIVLEKIEK